MCRDDERTRALIPDLGRRVVSYGLDEDADIRAQAIEPAGLRTRFTVSFRDGAAGYDVDLALPGLHNVRNALAAIAVAAELEIAPEAVQRALAQFGGIDRRLQVLGTVTTPAGRVSFVDDYGHHPTEIAASLAAVRAAWPKRRVVVVFQPHRYSRTRALLDDFAQVLASADVLLLTPVYPAGEEPIAGADGKALARAVRARGLVEPVFVEELGQLADALSHVLAAEDIVLTLGAGSIGAVAGALPAALAVRAPVGVKP
jgi:UDP-N-acetylmuramate--alanine ligase